MSRERQTDCYIRECLELQKLRYDFESSRAESMAVLRAVSTAASMVAPRAVSMAVSMAVPQAAVWMGESRAELKVSPLHCYSSNCSHC